MVLVLCLRQLEVLTGLYLYQNMLTNNSLPNNLSDMTNLTSIILNTNFLNGTLPSRIGNLQALLRNLYVYRNAFILRDITSCWTVLNSNFAIAVHE